MTIPHTEADDGEEVEFGCKTKTEGPEGKLKDKINFKIFTDDVGLHINVSYEQDVETDTSETETETEYEILFDRIVEYKKSESSGVDGAFDWKEDIVVSELLLNEFGQFSEIGLYDGSTYVFSITTLDRMATFTFTISQSGQGALISSNKMKIDFELDSYGWVRQDTYAALLSSVVSEREVEIEYEGGGKRETEDVKISFAEDFEGTGIRPYGEFTWAKDAIVYDLNYTETKVNGDGAVEVMASENGIPIKVVATSPSDGTDKVAFSFVGDSAMAANYIYWDPKAGIGYSDGSRAVSLLVSFTGILSALSLLFLW